MWWDQNELDCKTFSLKMVSLTKWVYGDISTVDPLPELDYLPFNKTSLLAFDAQLSMKYFPSSILRSYLSKHLTNNALLGWASQQKSLSSIAWSIRWKVSFAQNRSFDLGPFFSGHWINFIRQLGRESFRCRQHQSVPRKKLTFERACHNSVWIRVWHFWTITENVSKVGLLLPITLTTDLPKIISVTRYKLYNIIFRCIDY